MYFMEESFRRRDAETQRKTQRRHKDTSLCRSLRLRVSASNSSPNPLVILPSKVRPLAFALFVVPLPGLPSLLFRSESPLFVAADPSVRVQPLEHELRRGRPYRVRLIRAQAQILHLLHQPLDAAELLHHGG